jgi:hypothetical protein
MTTQEEQSMIGLLMASGAVTGGIGSAVGAGLEGALGIWQLIKGAQYAKTPHPTMTMPEGVTTAENMYKNLAGGDMPGMSEATQEIQGSAAASFNRAKEATNSPAALLSLANNQAYGIGKNLNKLATENADWQTKQQENLARFEGTTKAGWQDKIWDWNSRDPYERAMYMSSMMTEGGLQNLTHGASSQNLWNMLKGGKGTQTQTETPYFLNKDLYQAPTSGGGNGTTDYSKDDWIKQILGGSNSGGGGAGLTDWSGIGDIMKQWGFNAEVESN